MASTTSRGKASKNGSRQESFEWKGFCNIRLDREEKARVEQHGLDAEAFAQQLWQFTDELYKVSFSYDAEHDSYICSLTCKNPSSPNNGYTISGRGPDLLTSFASILVKHYEIAPNKDWTQVVVSSGRPRIE